MHCSHCQQEHPDTLKYCPITGKALSPTMATCWKCQREILASASFCTYCGAKQDKPPGDSPSKLVHLGLLITGILLMVSAGIMLRKAFQTTQASSEPLALWDTSPPSAVAQPTQFIAVTNTSILATLSSPTPKPTITQPATATALPVPTPTEVTFIQPIDLKVNPKDNADLVLVPSGPFLMGADPDSKDFWGAEAPQHQVTLTEFWIYRTEVTNAMYQLCVAVKACPRPARLSSNTRQNYYENPAYAAYPVIYVSYVHAVSYCRWAGGRLPTEAEWEKAARGDDGRMFPWGNGPARPMLANYGARDTEPVGSYPAGASPYGAYDMAGNVLEWVFDYMQETYYQVSPDENPRGPTSGTRRVYRGGAWHHQETALRTAARASAKPDYTGNDIGFRCVIDNP